MRRRELVRRLAIALPALALLIPLCLAVLATVGVWRLATTPIRAASRRETQSRALVAHAVDVTSRQADDWAAADHLYTAVHIPAQRSAS